MKKFFLPPINLSFFRSTEISIAAALFAVFALLAEGTVNREMYKVDSLVSAFIRGFATPELTSLMKLFTFLGSPFMVIITALLAVTYLKKKRFSREPYLVASSLAGAWLLNELFKQIFRRPRPDVNRLVEAAGFSFPSGHAMVSTAFYGLLAYLLWKNSGGRLIRQLTTCALILTVLLTGISRVYLGVHYPSDVMAGFAAGGACLALSVTIYTNGRGKN